MTGKDITNSGQVCNQKIRGHKPTLSSVSNTFSDISCMTDISEVSNNSEDDITMSEETTEQPMDRISLKSLTNTNAAYEEDTKEEIASETGLINSEQTTSVERNVIKQRVSESMNTDDEKTKTSVKKVNESKRQNEDLSETVLMERKPSRR